MLMFDNAIFASFIPQILLFVGYLTCLIPTSYTKPELNHEALVINYIHAERVSIEHSSVVSFYDFVKAEKSDNECVSQIFQSGYILRKQVFPDNTFSPGERHCYKLFSRPPPSFFC